ncbi:MAG: PDZ domain-containing protein [Steroidobacteraceae bacterium]|nr:PDZ domain-containing protein [Steroidobacteraceae bacterium]MDW8260178.1 PDZ domain-containing protein [Gammaproteobacteria bacterium]
MKTARISVGILMLIVAAIVPPHAQAGQAPPASRPADGSAASTTDLARRLEEARARLDAAIREVTELSMQLGSDAGLNVLRLHGMEGRRAVLGVRLAEDPADRKAGARVAAVSPGGPAATAGVQPGDLIVAIDGYELRGKDDPVRELIERMRQVEPEQKVKLKLQRDRQILDVDVVTRRADPGRWSFTLPPRADGPGARAYGFGLDDIEPMIRAFFPGGPLAGLELATVTPKLGQYFGTEKGVLVLKAPADNPLKLEEGDVILAIGGREPTSAAHALRILRSYQPGEKVPLRVQRQRKPLTFEAEMTAGPDPGTRRRSDGATERRRDRRIPSPPAELQRT